MKNESTDMGDKIDFLRPGHITGTHTLITDYVLYQFPLGLCSVDPGSSVTGIMLY